MPDIYCSSFEVVSTCCFDRWADHLQAVCLVQESSSSGKDSEESCRGNIFLSLEVREPKMSSGCEMF